MIQVVAHRGAWASSAERNSPSALRFALSRGWGVELDVRDSKGELVVSHDPPRGKNVVRLKTIEDVLSAPLPVFVNVKADGLAKWLRLSFLGDEVFVFDMSVPDTQAYLDSGFRVFTRQSEEETQPAFYGQAVGVWMDQLRAPWIDGTEIETHLEAGKRVAIVSDELHGRPHMPLWELLRPIEDDQPLYLCTDLPNEAELYFGSV